MIDVSEQRSERLRDAKSRDEKERISTEEEVMMVGVENRQAGKVVFWIVARMLNKDNTFWKGLKEWEVVMMMEIL